MARWIGTLLVLVAGIASAMAFASAQPRQVGPGLPCLPVGGCPTSTTETTTTGQTAPPPQTTPQSPPADPNAPQVGDGPAPHHPAHNSHGVRVAQLSDEHTFTTWATYRKAARVTSKPFGHGRRITTLHPLTPDRLTEVYVVLRSQTDGHGHQSLQVRVPVRPNGTKGWVTRSALSAFRRVNTQIIVDRRTL